MKLSRILLGFLLALPFGNRAVASRLVVAPAGPQESYSTIQSAVDAAKPGDTVEIQGGVYFERVVIAKGGEPERPLTVEAAPGALVVINAGRKLEAPLKPAEGLPGVYAAKVGEELAAGEVGLWEMPSRLRLSRVFTPEQTAGRLGSWCYDAKAGRLYIRSSGRAPADRLAFWLESAGDSAVTVAASHVRLRHLEATLGQNGFLVKPKNRKESYTHVTIEGCRAFCNSWAGIHVSGDDHLIVRNETFANNTYGIQLRFGVNRVRVLDNCCYLNGPNNGEPSGSSVPTDLGIYSQGSYNLFEGNIAEGIHEDVYRNKTGHGADPTNVFRGNVVRGNQTPSKFGVYNNTLLVDGLGMRTGMYRNGGGPSPLRTWEAVDPLGLQRACNLIHPLVQEKDPHFADPSYRDYRLQGDSPYHGYGAHPGRPEVYYIDPKNGSDQNSGLSVSAALATPQAALDQLSASATIYLLPGDYKEPLDIKNGGLDAAHPLLIRAHGRSGKVRLLGGARLENAQFIEIEGVEFASRLEVENVRGAAVKRSVFSGKEAGLAANKSPELALDRCTFAGSGVALRFTASPNARVTQSLFVDCAAVWETDALNAAFFDFNAYTRCRGTVGGKPFDGLEAIRAATPGNDRHSLSGAVELLPGFVLPSGSGLAMAGADFGPLGARVEDAAAHLEITHLRAAGLSPTGATLLWETPGGATFAEITLANGEGKTLRQWEPSYLLQIMGTQFDLTMLTEAFYSSRRHAVISGLKPGASYKVRLVARDREGNRSKPFETTFRTPKEYAAPVTRYLSPNGDDSADGAAPEHAWRSFAHALATVAPGDTVILLPGRYHEILRPQVSGTPERKITIRSQEPQAAVLDLAQSQRVGVELFNTNDIEIDGLLIADGRFPHSMGYLLNHAERITLRNCEMDYPAGSDFEKLRLGYWGVVAHEAPGLRVENNLFLCAVTGVAASRSPGTVVRHNTIIGEGNNGVVLIPGDAKEDYTIEGNLFYRTISGYKTNPCVWVFDPMPRLVCDYNLYYIPKKAKGTIGKLPSTERLGPLDAWSAATGLDRHSLQAEPVFTDPQARVFTLKPGSPGTGKARDGRDIGRVK